MTTELRIETPALLARLPLFADLPQACVHELAEHARVRRLAKGEMLFQKGDAATGFYVVIYGQIKLAFQACNGNEKVADIVDARQNFGEAVMLAQRPYPVFAQALADSLLLCVPRASAFRLLEGEPIFARRLLIGLALHNHLLMHEIESYTLYSSTQRVICYLLHHCPQNACDGSEIALPTSKQIAASRLNLTPETFSRILHDLVADGLIAIDGRRIVMRSVARLRTAVAEPNRERQHAAPRSTRARPAARQAARGRAMDGHVSAFHASMAA